MKIRLLVGECIRFLSVCLLFGLAAVVFYGVISVGIWLANRIQDGECIAGLALGGFCVIDSLLLSLGATIGATAAFAFLRIAVAAVLKFVGNLWRIATLSEEQIALIVTEIERDARGDP